MSIPVAIARILEYESTMLDSATALVLEEAGVSPSPGTRVLVKPNLVAPSNARHSTTNPRVVRAACMYLLDCGARITVADSPAYGPASFVAKKSGLAKEMSKLGLSIRTLGRPAPLQLSCGTSIGLSQDATEADMILNIPKLKVHCQMTMSASVKNLFGCVIGFRKAMAHNRLGHTPEIFRSMLMDIYAALPQAYHLMDGIHPLHKDGPIKGEPYALGLLAASPNGIALDTTAYTILNLRPKHVPLWNEALHRKMDGADPAEIHYPLEQPELFNHTGFIMSPERALEFTMQRLLKGRIRNLLKHFRK